MEEKLEPIFSRQEQSIVYLFSRYWEQIPEFKSKLLLQIQTRFPDMYIVNDEGEAEAIEFEYALSDFNHSRALRKLSKTPVETLASLKKNRVNLLHVVYWEHDEEVSRANREARSCAPELQLNFVCLKEYFKAEVRRIPGDNPWQASWQFTQRRKPVNSSKVYTRDAIETALGALKDSIERVNLPGRRTYRTLGFNKPGSNFIELDHWQRIRFFTTTANMERGRLPHRLFMKPSGSKYFNGYFDVQSAILFPPDRDRSALNRFFKDFYFYDYSRDAEPFDRVKGFVCDFRPLSYACGRDIWRYLSEKKYSLGTLASLVIENEEHIRELDKMAATGAGLE